MTAGSRATTATKPRYQFRDPDGHRFELFYEQDRYVPPEELRPRLKNVPQRHVDRGASVNRIDHVNILAADIAANRRFAEEQLGYRTYEQVILDNGEESGAWMSLSIAAHELIYAAITPAAAAGCITLPGSSTPARSACAPPICSWTPTSRSRPPRPSTPWPRGVPLRLRARRQPRRVHTGTDFIYDPAYEPIRWTEAERARGQAWGVKTIETFHTYGTPPLDGTVGPPIPPTSALPTPRATIA